VLFLLDTSSGGALALGNAHLVGDPSKKDSQLKQLNGMAKTMAKEPGFMRVICGDFNGECEPDSAVGEWMVQQKLCEAATHASWAGPGKAERLDHIFFDSCAVAETPARVVSAAMDAGTVESGLPNATSPSDHIPVQIAIKLLMPPASADSSSGGEVSISLTTEQKQAIVAKVDELQAQAPAPTKGKPSPEQLAQIKGHSTKMTALKKEFETDSVAAAEFSSQYIKILKKTGAQADAFKKSHGI
jgi:hypothetical protein